MKPMILAALFSLALVACGPSPTEPGTTPDGGSENTPDASTNDTVTLKAPKLDELMKMGGAFHLMWTNLQDDCDTVRIERKTETTEWADRFNVPGTANNKMDGTATSDTTYTYRLRCEKGGVFSDYSNELSGNPTK